MSRKNVWIKILVLTNIVSLLFLAALSVHYNVPQKVLNRLGIINIIAVKQFPGYKTNTIKSLTFEREDFDIVMLGDSITHGGDWNELLNKADIANLGIGGDTTEGILNRIGDIYLVNPKKCFIMIGINDVFGKIPLETIIGNYRKIIKELRDHNIEVIIESTLTISDSAQRRDAKKINRVVTDVNQALKHIAEEEHIPYIDVNSILGNGTALNTRYTSGDGVHLNKEGYALWGRVLKKYL